jgi:hypothetical protein
MQRASQSVAIHIRSLCRRACRRTVEWGDGYEKFDELRRLLTTALDELETATRELTAIEFS